MERRELIKMIALLTGGAFIGGGLLTGCNAEDEVGGIAFSKTDILFLDEVADTILPATKTPGAKAAGVGKFIERMVNNTYNPENQQVFHKGIALLNEACKKDTGKSFTAATPEQRTALLITIDAAAKAYQKNKKEGEPSHYFTMMKQLSLLGFFTSKIGATEVLRYKAIPGKFDGDYPYKKGDKAWAT
jgi:Gluconate 2-dehydrogenase subunit 3